MRVERREERERGRFQWLGFLPNPRREERASGV